MHIPICAVWAQSGCLLLQHSLLLSLHSTVSTVLYTSQHIIDNIVYINPLGPRPNMIFFCLLVSEGISQLGICSALIMPSALEMLT